MTPSPETIDALEKDERDALAEIVARASPRLEAKVRRMVIEVFAEEAMRLRAEAKRGRL